MNHNTEQELITAANNQGASFSTISDVIDFFYWGRFYRRTS